MSRQSLPARSQTAYRVDSHHGRKPGGRRGFTLMELIVTLSVLTVLTLIAVPAIRVDALEADAAAHRVRAAIHHAQRLALVQQHHVLVSFDTVQGRIRIAEDRNVDGDIQNTERVTWRPLEQPNSFATPPNRVNGGATAQSIVGSNLIVVDSMPTVVFRRDGSLSSDLEVYVRSRRGGKESRRAISVGMATGRVEWHKHLPPSRWRRGGI